MTAELKVRFLLPVKTGQPASVHAWLSKSSPLLYVLEAKVTQQDEVKATAVGKFMPAPHVPSEPGIRYREA